MSLYLVACREPVSDRLAKGFYRVNIIHPAQIGAEMVISGCGSMNPYGPHYFAVCKTRSNGSALIVEHLEGLEMDAALAFVRDKAREHGVELS